MVRGTTQSGPPAWTSCLTSVPPAGFEPALPPPEAGRRRDRRRLPGSYLRFLFAFCVSGALSWAVVRSTRHSTASVLSGRVRCPVLGEVGVVLDVGRGEWQLADGEADRGRRRLDDRGGRRAGAMRRTFSRCAATSGCWARRAGSTAARSTRPRKPGIRRAGGRPQARGHGICTGPGKTRYGVLYSSRRADVHAIARPVHRLSQITGRSRRRGRPARGTASIRPRRGCGWPAGTRAPRVRRRRHSRATPRRRSPRREVIRPG